MQHPDPKPKSSEADVVNRHSPTQELQVVVNGEARTVEAGITVAGLLSELGIEADRVAVELNRAIVRKPEWDTTELRSGAVLEIVQFVGGG